MSDLFRGDSSFDVQTSSDELTPEYIPTEQDLADMAEAWASEPEEFFCANCGHVELVYSQSPDPSLCCDCYKYNNDYDDCQEAEAEALGCDGHQANEYLDCLDEMTSDSDYDYDQDGGHYD